MKTASATHHTTWDNGLTLVAEPMPWLQSAAFTIAYPAGCRFDPADRLGTANFTCEMVFRGGGPYDNRGLIEALEELGCDYYATCGLYHTFFGGALPAAGLNKALRVYAQVLSAPHFPENQLEDGRAACIQEIQALEDDLGGKTALTARQRYFGDPYGRHADGDLESIEALTLAELRRFYDTFYQPNGMLIAVAGRFDWSALVEQVAELFGTQPPRPPQPPARQAGVRGYHHVAFPSNQTYISIAWPGLPYRDPDFYRLRGAIGVLSDGMSSRLFREVRERRGLCYSVGAHCYSILDQGAVFAYSATTTESAQQTLEVMLEQIRALREGISEDELRRMKVQFRSGLVMKQESCRARVNNLVGDLFHLGRIRSMEEIQQQVLQLTVADINRFLSEYPLNPEDIVTLGEQPLEVGREVPSTSA